MLHIRAEQNNRTSGSILVRLARPFIWHLSRTFAKLLKIGAIVTPDQVPWNCEEIGDSGSAFTWRARSAVACGADDKNRYGHYGNRHRHVRYRCFPLTVE